jgi:glyoxylase-like metal-dependent hydrolase (beta-lactamase superfamily II)
MSPRIVPITCPYPGTSVQAYYVDAERPTLIDTGGSSHPHAEIAAALAAEGTGLDRIEVIINTHGHWDHAGGNAGVQEAGGARTWIHVEGVKYLESNAPHIEGYATMQARLLFPITPVQATDSFSDLFLPSAPPERTIADGDVLDLGNLRLAAIHAPGHSEDLVALFWEDEGMLILADAVQGTGSRPGGCPLYFTSCTDARASIKRLMDVPFRALHTGHPFGRLSTAKRTTSYDAAAGKAFLAESLEAIDLLESALEETMRDQPELPFLATVAATIDRVRKGGRWSPVDDPGLGVSMGAAVTLDTLRRDLQ